jgi:modulator of FtsH protease HflK
MRRAGRPSEIRRLAAPLAGLLEWAWQRMHWWVAAMAVLYVLSGITIVKPDEVAVVLRWGRLVGATPALQQHGPGLLFAFPKPIDQVVRVKVRHISELHVSTLATSEISGWPGSDTLDPLTEGYALTGDRNIVKADVIARYRVREPAEWAFYGPKSDEVLRVEVTAALVRSLGEMGVDRVLADGRRDLIATATRRAQAGLDAAHSGLELTSLELTRLSPPDALAEAFDAVQTAFITAETNKKQALAFAQKAIPDAQAAADSAVQTARADSAAALARAAGDYDAFRALDREYRKSSEVVRERLYRDAVDRATAAAGNIRWVPPPAGRRYHGLRISIPATQPEIPAPTAPEGNRAQGAAPGQDPLGGRQ